MNIETPMNIEIPKTLIQPIKEIANQCGLPYTEVANFVKDNISDPTIYMNVYSRENSELTELTEEKFWNLRFTQPWLVFLGAKTFKEAGQMIVDQFEADFNKIPLTIESDAGYEEDFSKCNSLKENWDWNEYQPIIADVTNGFLKDGHHRTLTLAVIFLSGEQPYRPVPCVNINPQKIIYSPLNDSDYIEECRSILNDFKTIDKPDSLLKMPCALPPTIPDRSVGWRTMQEWVRLYKKTPDSLKRIKAYQDMKLHVDNFDPKAVPFLTPIDLDFASVFESYQTGSNRKRPIDLLLKRHKWIAAQFILSEQWQPKTLIPNLFLVD